jgi:serine/threonine protein phosphatase PrpC
LTTSRRTKVCSSHIPVYLRLNPFLGEKARIVAAGGFVDFGRVNGNLALSRAIGDFEFKKSADLSPEQQIVTAFPDVVTHEVTNDDEFLVIACDGKPCFDGLDSRRVANVFTRHMGLPVFSSCGGVREERHCSKARAAPHL